MPDRIWTEYGDNQNHLSCVSGIFHSLLYHKWHNNVKRIVLSHKRRKAEKSDRVDDTTRNSISNVYHTQHVEELGDSEPSHFLDACQSKPKTRSTHHRSLRARIKSLVSDEKVKKQQGSKSGPSLQRTFSIHHLEPSDERLDNVNAKWAHPIIFFPKNVGSSGKFEENSEDGEYVGVLEIYKVNSDLSQNHTQKADYGKMPKSKARFAKSRSFPVADFAHMPSKIESKQRESWFFKKAYYLPKVFTSDVLLGLKKDSDNNELNEEFQETRFPPDSRPELDDQEIYERNEETRLPWGSTEEFEDQESNKENQETKFSLGPIQNLEYQYTRLFNNNMVSDKPKLNHSRSLNLSTGYEIPPSTNSFFRRLRSLPHLEFREELNDSHFSSNDGKRFMRVNSKASEEIIYPNVEEHVEESDYSREEIVENLTIFQASKGIKPDNNFENDKYVPKSHPLHKDADFDYVKALLELSGFADSGFDATWHSSEQPLGALVFQELEAYWPHDPEDSDNTASYYHRENIFDLVNEILLRIYEISFPYYPRPLSSNCRIRPFCRTQILDEVWKLVSLPEVEPSLDSFVSRDFDLDKEWMNLQMESEFIGVEIEQLIFDELLEELMSS